MTTKITNLTATLMRQALRQLDGHLRAPATLILGGGGAMVLAYDFPLSTLDLDAVPKGIELAELDTLIKLVADELNFPGDWLNPYFSTFAHTLPSDYGSRLKEVFRGKQLIVQALGKEDLLVMKCFAHRPKDVGHAKALIKKGADVDQVETHIESLRKKRIPGADEALDFLDDVRLQLS